MEKTAHFYLKSTVIVNDEVVFQWLKGRQFLQPNEEIDVHNRLIKEVKYHKCIILIAFRSFMLCR